MASASSTGYHPGQAWNKLCSADVLAALRACAEPKNSKLPDPCPPDGDLLFATYKAEAKANLQQHASLLRRTVQFPMTLPQHKEAKESQQNTNEMRKLCDHPATTLAGMLSLSKHSHAAVQTATRLLDAVQCNLWEPLTP